MSFSTKTKIGSLVSLLALALSVLIAPAASVAAQSGESSQATSGPRAAAAGEVVVEFTSEFVETPGLPELPAHGRTEQAAEVLERAEQIRDAHRNRFTPEANARAGQNAGDRVPPVGGALTAGASVAVGGFTVVYDAANPTPAHAKAAIEAGIASWADKLSTNGAPVVVEVSWTSFGHPGILGFAGPTGFFTDPSLPTGYLYPTALTNVLSGSDVNGAIPEITVALNSDLEGNGTWYYGTGTPPSNQIDLTTVVTHEVGHGVGFVTSAADNGGLIELANPPFVYDALMQQSGTPVINMANPGAVLTSSDADIKISTTQIAPLFVPGTWYQGTSASHFLNAGATAPSLMAPTLNPGVINRTLDGYTLGVINEIGWPLVPGPTQPTITSTSADETSVNVSWKGNEITSGLPADNYRVQAYDGSTQVASDAVSGSARAHTLVGLPANTSLEIRVVPVTNGQTGPAATANVSTGDGPVYVEPGTPPSFVRDLWLDHQVFRVYQAHFLRTPDKAGFIFWRDQRAAGMPLLDIVGEFQASTEFQNRYGSLSDGQFVNLVYANVLGRAADSAGFNHWTGQLAAGLTRAEMMLGFVEGAEYVNRTATLAAHSPTEGSVRRLYQAYFDREPSSSDLDYWVAVVDSGSASLLEVSDFFSASTEFVNLYGSLSDGQFVNLVYDNVLDRAAEPGGFDHWTAQLAAGMSRGEVMAGFSESEEYIKRTGTLPQIP